jgi:hypothetical protein
VTTGSCYYRPKQRCGSKDINKESKKRRFNSTEKKGFKWIKNRTRWKMRNPKIEIKNTCL